MGRAGSAAGGAMAGAQMGSAAGPVGTAVGALIGAGLGYISGGKGNIEQQQKEQSMANQLQAQQYQLGLMKSAQPGLVNINKGYYNSPIWGEKMAKASELMGTMPGYEKIGLESQGVQDIYNLLKKRSEQEASGLLAKRDVGLAANKSFGSSFNVAQNQALAKQFAEQDVNNQIAALDAYKNLYTGNLASATGLMDWYTKQPTYVPGQISGIEFPKQEAGGFESMLPMLMQMMGNKGGGDSSALLSALNSGGGGGSSAGMSALSSLPTSGISI